MPKWALVAVLVLVAAPISASEKAKSQDTNAAILQQLIEIQTEMKALREEIVQIRKSVADLGRPRTLAAPAPTLPPAISLERGAGVGSPSAPVAIVEFSEFQCPFCRRFHDETLAQIRRQYVDTGKIRYVFRHLPLDMHGQAKPAALAAECASKQDAFWAMHDGLFANQSRLGESLFQELAGTLHLDVDAFRACVKDPETRKLVEADVAYANSIGTTGTPTFFVGRLKDGQLTSPQRITGAQSLATFSAVIDPLLK